MGGFQPDPDEVIEDICGRGDTKDGSQLPPLAFFPRRGWRWKVRKRRSEDRGAASAIPLLLVSLLLRVLSLLRLLINELFSLETKPFLGLENRLLPTPLPAVPTSALLYKGDRSSYDRARRGALPAGVDSLNKYIHINLGRGSASSLLPTSKKKTHLRYISSPSLTFFSPSLSLFFFLSDSPLPLRRDQRLSEDQESGEV